MDRKIFTGTRSVRAKRSKSREDDRQTCQSSGTQSWPPRPPNRRPPRWQRTQAADPGLDAPAPRLCGTFSHSPSLSDGPLFFSVETMGTVRWAAGCGRRCCRHRAARARVLAAAEKRWVSDGTGTFVASVVSGGALATRTDIPLPLRSLQGAPSPKHPANPSWGPGQFSRTGPLCGAAGTSGEGRRRCRAQETLRRPCGCDATGLRCGGYRVRTGPHRRLSGRLWKQNSEAPGASFTENYRSDR